MKRTIPQREPQADVNAVRRETESGDTVRRPYATREDVLAFICGRRPDPTFRRDMRAILSETVDVIRI